MAKKTQRTKKTAAKRFDKTSKGMKRSVAGRNHKTGKMSAKFTRKHRKGTQVSKSDGKRMSELI